LVWFVVVVVVVFVVVVLVAKKRKTCPTIVEGTKSSKDPKLLSHSSSCSKQSGSVEIDCMDVFEQLEEMEDDDEEVCVDGFTCSFCYLCYPFVVVVVVI